MIPVSEVKDEVFASKGMGDGVGIIPSDGNVYAPFDGTVEAIFPTGHAVGLSANGIEALIHIGVNTVELNGKGFQAKVKQGDHVNKGDLLVTYNKDFVEEQGYDPTVIFVVTNMEDEAQLEMETGKEKNAMEAVMYIKR